MREENLAEIFIRKIIILMSLTFSSLTAGMEIQGVDFSQHLGAIKNIVAATLTSCMNNAVSNPGQLAMAKSEFAEVAKGVLAVVSEELTALALKKDYPNICHVMPKRFFEDIGVSQHHGRECTVYRPPMWGGGCLLWSKTKTPEYSYYWPKYFIEVSEKGNDTFPAFSAGNQLYTFNRKISHQLSGFLDVEGPIKLVSKVQGMSSLIKSVTQFDITPSPGDVNRLSQVAVLTPLEKLRIRANKKSDMPSFEVNIWPIALSATMAENLTVCGKGGYQWPLKGVAMTCPVAMSKDAWSYWDSGLIDYLNPNAIRGMVSASHPTACIADNLASTAFDSLNSQDRREPVMEPGRRKDRDTALANLPNSFRGVGLCSMPVLGSAEAIASQTVNIGQNFKGPWCTMWGPVVPRHSTHVFANAFGFANAALKFKLLAHDLFGVPRGKAERWTLAYPWEESGQFLEKQKGWLNDFLKKSSVSSQKIQKFLKTPSYGRSTTLMIPGDPRLMDEFNPQDLWRDTKNLGREIAYLASLNTAATSAERASLNALKKKVGPSAISPSELLQKERQRLQVATNLTARTDKEPIYAKRHYCYVWGEKQGTFISGNTQIEIPRMGKINFLRISNPNSCHENRSGQCIDRHKLTGRCLRPESIYYFHLVRQEVVGFRRVQNPKVTRVEGPVRADYKEYPTNTTHHRYFTYEEKVVHVGQIDTREYVLEPDPNNPAKTVDPDGEYPDTALAVSKAAHVSTWVGSEIARAKYEDLSGQSLLPGKKRIYTIFEKIQCKPKKSDGGTLMRKETLGVPYWNDCAAAVRYEVRKYFQTKLLRPICDRVLGHHLGEPFK